MTGVLYSLARFCVRRRMVVLGVWLVVTIALVAVSHRLGDNTNDNLSLPGTDSQHATNVLKRSFPAQANGTSPIVLHAKNGKLTDQSNANAVNQAVANLSKTKDVAAVVNPLTPQGASALSRIRPRVTPRSHSVSAPVRCRYPMPRRSSTPRRNRRGPRASKSRPADSWARRCPSRPPSRASSWGSSPPW
jgi:predicted RND superfamily exporter protein